jgi:hypothetical protein
MGASATVFLPEKRAATAVERFLQIDKVLGMRSREQPPAYGIPSLLSEIHTMKYKPGSRETIRCG